MKLRSRYSAQLAAAGSEGQAVPVQICSAPATTSTISRPTVAPVAAERVPAIERHTVPVRSLRPSAATVALRHCNDTLMQHLEANQLRLQLEAALRGALL